MQLSSDYLERTYAGVLGKVVGVYIGRPFEGATYERIKEELGPIWYYVHEKRNVPLIVTDDDISGTFTFIRALDDYDLDMNAGDEWSEKVGKTWLNYLINRKTILWWGGIGRSSEHTAYARLAAGIPAPRSGSIEENGSIIGEQIGAQIFIDGWGMVSPGDPERAAWLAGQAGRVSHDGESVYAAQVVAAMEAAAYTERDMDTIIELGLAQVPRESTIRRVADALRSERARSERWEDAYKLLLGSYGYDKYKGACHVVPNHGLILMTLMYAPDSFQKAMMIVNTAGWDTDCNSGNVGCIMGIHLGLEGFHGGPDYLGPVRDQIYLPTSDGSSCISDATIQAYRMVNRARALSGASPLAPKDGARYHFELPGSTQGFRSADGPDWTRTVRISNSEGHSKTGTRCLRVDFEGVGLGQGVAAVTETFVPAHVFDAPGYELTACPVLYPGQTVSSRVTLAGPEGSLSVCLLTSTYSGEGELVWLRSRPTVVAAGGTEILTYTVPETGGYPILKIGIEARVAGDEVPGTMSEYASLPSGETVHINAGTLFIDYLRFDGVATVDMSQPDRKPHESWRRQWVNGMTAVDTRDRHVRLIQDAGRGLFYTGAREWTGYKVSAEIRPHFFTEGGIGLHIQGMTHFLAAVVRRDGTAAIVEMWDEPTVLASAPADFEWESPLTIEAWVEGTTVHARIGSVTLSGEMRNARLATGGGTGMVLTEGTAQLLKLSVAPA